MQSLLSAAPPAAPPVQAAQLSPSQAAALREAEKLTAIVEGLDRKTRERIAAEMRKPGPP